MTEIIPAILPHSLTHIREQFGKILHSARKVQVDIVDGKYAGTNIKLDETEYLVMREEDVMGVLE